MLCEFGLLVVLVSDGDVDEQIPLKRRTSAISSGGEVRLGQNEIAWSGRVLSVVLGQKCSRCFPAAKNIGVEGWWGVNEGPFWVTMRCGGPRGSEMKTRFGVRTTWSDCYCSWALIV